MSFKEQCEALEEAGIDPDDHRFYAMRGQLNKGCPLFL